MRPEPWTLTDWALALLTLAALVAAGQFIWNTMLRHMLADILDWEDEPPEAKVPPTFWIGVYVGTAVY